MPKQETLGQSEEEGGSSVHFGPHGLWSTGVLPRETLLTVDSYSLACVPYQFSLRKAILLGAFSPEEIGFFARFSGGLAGLSLAFQGAADSKPSKVFCRCQIETIGPVQGRDQVALIVCQWKPIPPVLAGLLEESLRLGERLKAGYAELRDRALPVNPDTALRLGYNNYAIMTVEGRQQKLALFSVAVNRLDFLLPMSAPELAPGTAVSFSLFFQRYRFSCRGRMESCVRQQSGVQKGRASLDFCAELVQLLAEYHESHGQAGA
jgi:hypothetical protein